MGGATVRVQVARRRRCAPPGALRLIVELAKAGVQQKEIRKIAGCDMRRVTRIAKAINNAKPGAVEQ